MYVYNTAICGARQNSVVSARSPSPIRSFAKVERRTPTAAPSRWLAPIQYFSHLSAQINRRFFSARFRFHFWKIMREIEISWFDIGQAPASVVGWVVVWGGGVKGENAYKSIDLQQSALIYVWVLCCFCENVWKLPANAWNMSIIAIWYCYYECCCTLLLLLLLLLDNAAKLSRENDQQIIAVAACSIVLLLQQSKKWKKRHVRKPDPNYYLIVS